ncbi:serine/threonine protein kinase [Leptolyngbya sp. NIES-2104]|uniref:serine/threonine protein kinase n=1 Tax=Leptolyngbya sp. NIES-2104 TaxID=1552121 RepID=UPI00073F8F79|nr:protein kinase [Leptolyngbya sp. NIES-2104]
MSQLLSPQQCIQTTMGLSCQIEELLGSGTQGEVYRARLSDRSVALKWFHSYYIHQDFGLLERLNEIVHLEAPNDQFLWPFAIVTSPETSGFGYVMQLREGGYLSTVDLVKRRVKLSFRVLSTIGLELADSFLQLHSRGLCYRDISLNNVYFHPHSGKVLIGDNDNVTIDGSTSGGVLGTPDFMAPEVVRREALPSQQTDRYSLAVLLFCLLHNHHPLYGKKVLDISCLDLPARMRICGTDPVFIFDPNNLSNAALPEAHLIEAGANAIEFWSIYPQFLKALFVQSFTIGLRDPREGRVRESLWRSTMVKLRDSIFYCPHCEAENFYDIESFRSAVAKHCWRCEQPLEVPARMRLDSGAMVMLNFDTLLYPHHLDRDCPYDFSQPAARVIPRFDQNQLILQNLSDVSWKVFGTSQDIQPLQMLPLESGLKIHFGNTIAEIRL